MKAKLRQIWIMTDRPTDGQTVSHFQEVYVFIYVDFLLTSKSCFEGNSSARSNTNPPKNNNNNNVRLIIDKNPPETVCILGLRLEFQDLGEC